MRLLEANGHKMVHYAEPYSGGAAVALALLFEDYAATVSINDLSRPVYAFWFSVLNNAESLCRRIRRTDITMGEWRRQRNIYDHYESANLDELGFATLFLNRTNRSGIIGGGVIGGKDQIGSWLLDARFNKAELIERIRRINRYRSRISLYNLDAIKFIDTVTSSAKKNSFMFLDPPYIETGTKRAKLYLNTYNIDDHRRLARRTQELEDPWIVTYDYAAVRRKLYTSCRRIAYGLHYCAQDHYRGREVMFLSDSLRLPTGWGGSRPFSMTAAGSAYPLYGMLGCGTQYRATRAEDQ
jgi:DNA adenine methylase